MGTSTNGREVSVRARTGCEQDPPVEVAETADEVMIRVVVPEQVDPFFCVTEPQTHTVTLDAPLGARRLVPAPVNTR